MSEKSDVGDIDLGRETLSGTTAKIVTTVVGFLGTIVFARVLGPTGFGAFYLLLAITTISIRPLVGWSEAGKKRFSEKVSERQRSEIIGSQFVVAGVLSIVLLGVAVAASDYLIDYAGVPEAPLLFVGLFVATGLYNMLYQGVQGRGKVGVSTWTGTLKSVLEVPAQLVFVLSGLGVVGMVVGHVIALAIACPILLYYIDSRPAIPSRETFASLWTYARYSIPNSFLGSIYSRFDVLLLGALLAPAAAGYYEAALRVSTPAIFVSTVAGSAIHPRVSSLTSQDLDPADDIRNTISYTSVFAFPLLFGSLALADEVIVTIYGDGFAPAGTLLVGLAVYQLLQSQTTILLNVVGGWDRPDVATRLFAIALTVNIILGVILTAEFGAIGVVFATIVAESIRYLGLLHFTSDRLSWRVLFPRPLFAQFAAGLLMLGAVGVFRNEVPATSTVNLLMILGVGALVYFGALFAISEQHRTTARTVLRN